LRPEQPRSALIGVDVGGSKVAAALITPDGAIIDSVTRPALAPDGTVKAACAAADGMVRRAAVRGVELGGLGAGFPEYVDRHGNLTSREVLEWDIQPRVALANVVPDLPCVVESDVRCAALAEARLGHGAELHSFVYVSVGTGLSSAFVIGGQPWDGTRGEAIGLGELAVPATVDPSWAGTLERYSSGLGVARRYAASASGPTGGAAEVEAAAATDEAARLILTSAGRALGAALAGLVAVLDPDAVVVGGGLGSSSGVMWTALNTTYSQSVSGRAHPPPLRHAMLGPLAGMVGAGLLVAG
jgi:glucokinase